MDVARIHRILPEEIEAFLEKVQPAYERYKGIAARLEDDVIITADGNEVLSSKLPKTTKEIEKVMRKKSFFNR